MFKIGWITGALLLVFVPLIVSLVTVLVIVTAPLYLIYAIVDRIFSFIENLLIREKKEEKKGKNKTYSYIADAVKEYNSKRNESGKNQ
jgi:hypothetical protein